MAERAAKSRIKFAYYDRFWDSKTGNRKVLEDRAEKVPPAGYEAHMDGFLYCPGCFTPLSRTPKDKQIFSNGRLACYAHLPSNQHVLCDLKSAKP
ncbi:hypothetical protein [Ideonella sp.]|jgi:hypothetical protein|uniref:hypothetical protein n=1 Tax=Ideonella sp. TaxID=1929293 RepID=UPI0037C0AD57